MDLNEDYFLAKYSNEEDYNHALYEGPWTIADHHPPKVEASIQASGKRSLENSCVGLYSGFLGGVI